MGLSGSDNVSSRGYQSRTLNYQFSGGYPNFHTPVSLSLFLIPLNGGRATTEKAAPGKCILVTGLPGVGKSTLIMRVLGSLKASNPSSKLQGFCTREIRQGNQGIGFEVVTVGGQTAPLAAVNSSSPESLRWPSVGRYWVDVASFESVALPELQIEEDTGLFAVDEVGKMELFSSSFFPAVMTILDSNIPVLASIPIPKQDRDIPGVARLRNHPSAFICTLNPNNRDTSRERICSQLLLIACSAAK